MTTKTPKVSVLIAAFNGEKTILETIESVLAQDGVEFEVIVCDDASTDGTLDKLRQFRDPRIRVICNKKNSGLTATINRLIREARGDYIAFLDADDKYLPNKLRRCVEEIEETGCAGVSHDMKYLAHDGFLKGHIAAEIIFPGAFLGRSDIIMDLGGYREDLLIADSDFFCRFRTRGTIGFIHEPLTAVRLVAGSDSDTKWFDKRLVEHWFKEYPNTPMPFGTSGLHEWFEQKSITKRLALAVAWYGQRWGRRAAGSYLADQYIAAAWYSILSVILNPSYLAGRIRNSLSR